jgi:hypothetical protein
MTAAEFLFALGFTLWLLVCSITAAVKGRGLGWGVAAAFLPPLYLVLLKLRPRPDGKPPRVRCPLCKLGWVPLDRLPRVCSGCGETVSHVQLQDEIHKDTI